MKIIFISGGVISSLGKGIAAASIGSLIKNRGYEIDILKMDPYINVDPGTMSPFQHGEVFVTEDGYETDLDLGHYERFTNITTCKENNFTAGKIYELIIAKERRGDFLGETVQVVPHVTNQIKDLIIDLADKTEILIVEIGGTVGDIESLPFLEAARQIKQTLGNQNSVYIHLTLIPYLPTVQEIKTKPTQHSVGKLREIGIQPDIIMCRSVEDLSPADKDKISLFTSVKKEAVITAKDIDFIYKIPIQLKNEGLDKLILENLKLDLGNENNVEDWQKLYQQHLRSTKTINIGILGKYTIQKDSYTSLNESLQHAAIDQKLKLKLHYLSAESFESEDTKDQAIKQLKQMQGIVVPGGFGSRGLEGVITAIQIIREQNIPFLGICLGLQYATIEFARNVLGLKDADSMEMNKHTTNPVIALMREQKKVAGLGGTMRMGSSEINLQPDSLIAKIYGSLSINERHRHRYELNVEYQQQLQEKGFIISGFDKKTKLPEAIEIPKHKFFVAVQSHPEFKSRPNAPHPLFKEFIKISAA